MRIPTRHSLRRRRRSQAILVQCLVVVTAVSACDRTPQPLTLSDTQSRAIDELLMDRVRDQRIPGLAAAVLLNGSVAKRSVLGVSDIASESPVSYDTPFQLASTTKSFSSTAVMSLIADGTITLDDRIGDRLEALPESWRQTTIRQLLSHTSGLPDIVIRPGRLELIADNWDDALAQVADVPRPFPAGEQWAYNQTNYALLQLLMNRVTGKPIDSVLSTRFFAPLAMSNTFYPDVADSTRPCATNYERAHAGTHDIRPLVFPPFVHAAGGLCASLDDLIRWNLALDSGLVVPAVEQTAMWTATPSLNGGRLRIDERSGMEYGLGWIVDNTRHRRSVGSSGGNSTAYRRFIDEGMTIIVLHNGVVDPDGLIASIAALVRNEKPEPSSSPQTRLWDAASFGDTVAITQSLADGADVNALDTRSSGSGRRALNWAALFDHPDAIRLLIARGATIDAANKTGFTPLQHAAEAGAQSAFEALLAAGADPRHTNRAGTSIAETARANGHERLADMAATPAGRNVQ